MAPQAEAEEAAGEVRIPFPDAQAARQAAESLRPDDDGHLASRIDGDVLVLRAQGRGPMAILRTFDDAIACLRATGIA